MVGLPTLPTIFQAWKFTLLPAQGSSQISNVIACSALLLGQAKQEMLDYILHYDAMGSGLAGSTIAQGVGEHSLG